MGHQAYNGSSLLKNGLSTKNRFEGSVFHTTKKLKSTKGNKKNRKIFEQQFQFYRDCVFMAKHWQMFKIRQARQQTFAFAAK